MTFRFRTRTEMLHGYFLISYLTVIILCLGYDTATLVDPWTTIFYLSTLASYSVAYLLPAFAITMAGNRLLVCWGGKDALSPLNTFTVSVLAVSTTSMTLIALYADQQIYQLFGFHFNSFVINLITTSGGIDSMGGSGGANVIYGLICASFVGMQTVLYLGVRSLRHYLVK